MAADRVGVAEVIGEQALGQVHIDGAVALFQQTAQALAAVQGRRAAQLQYRINAVPDLEMIGVGQDAVGGQNMVGLLRRGFQVNGLTVGMADQEIARGIPVR